MNFEQISALIFYKMTKNKLFCTKILKNQKNVQKPFAIYSILCYNVVTRKNHFKWTNCFKIHIFVTISPHFYFIMRMMNWTSAKENTIYDRHKNFDYLFHHTHYIVLRGWYRDKNMNFETICSFYCVFSCNDIIT